MNTRVIRGAVVAFTAAVSIFSAGCSKIDHAKVEGSIRDGLKAKGIDMKTIDCPADRALKAGDTFDCKGVDGDGEHLVFNVTQKDGAGSIAWQMDGMIVNKRVIGDAIEHKVGKAADVKCPDKVVVLKVGQSFTCDVDIDSKTHKVLLTVSDKEGNLTWKITS